MTNDKIFLNRKLACQQWICIPIYALFKKNDQNVKRGIGLAEKSVIYRLEVLENNSAQVYFDRF